RIHPGDRRRCDHARAFCHQQAHARWRLHLLLFVPRSLGNDEGQAGLRLSDRLWDRKAEGRPHAGLLRCRYWRGTQPAATTLNASRAAASVASITASSCALDMKPASYADGARNTPRSSIAWKKRLNAAVSQAVAWA